MSKAVYYPICNPKIAEVSVLDLEQYRFNHPYCACSTTQIRCIPYLGASNDTDVFSLYDVKVIPKDNASNWTIKHMIHVLDGQIAVAAVMVGRGGLEPPTSRLSGVRSNHLSYRPNRDELERQFNLGGA